MSGNTIPAPISWTPSSFWDGNDGSWNSFNVQVGTPAQDFRIFPSTSGQELWLPVPDGCIAASPDNPGYCGYLRGTLPVNGANSSGFASNESSTWDSIGIFTLDAQQSEMGYGGNGKYGFDTVTWGNSSTSPELTDQVVAGIADPDWWVGLAGLGSKTINFTSFNEPVPSFLTGLANSSIIPSHSWGYTAGAAYRDNSPASLTLGGYDTNRLNDQNLTLSMNADNSRPLLVALNNIVAENTLSSSVNLLGSPTYHFIDSAVPHIWVPEADIPTWVGAFGLTYDNSTDLYLVNDTVHQQLLTLNPTITFLLAKTTTDNVASATRIEFPYAAFDLQASYPFYQNATKYFPIRRAANDSQYTIGRTFFQEAYVIADYERSTFSVSQASFEDLDTQHLVAIEKPTETETPSATATPQPAGGLGSGAIAGIVVGVVGGLAIIGLLAWFIVRRRKQKQAAIVTEKTDDIETFPDQKKPTLAACGSELPSENAVYEAEGTKPAYEVDSSVVTPAEMNGEATKWGKFGVQELHTPPVGYPQELYTPPIGHESGFLAEAPGDSQGRYELPGNHAEQRHKDVRRM